MSWDAPSDNAMAAYVRNLSDRQLITELRQSAGRDSRRYLIEEAANRLEELTDEL